MAAFAPMGAVLLVTATKEFAFAALQLWLLAFFGEVLSTAVEAFTIIGIASSNQVQRQQQRDEPVRENTHLVLDTLASRLRSYHLIIGVESLVFQVIGTQLIYIQSIVCTRSVKGKRVPGKSP